MGLQTWQNDNIRKSDVSISKNYLTAREVKELNRLTTILLDIFEDQLDIGRLVIMQDAQNLLDQQLAQLGRSVLKSGGSIKSSEAKRRSEEEYQKFDQIRKIQRQKEAGSLIDDLTAEAKKLPRTKK
jgi:hypothetical protein